MSGSIFGKNFSISTWGESHGKALGVVIDGCPAGIPLDIHDIQKDLNRRKPGRSPYSTPRSEDDTGEIVSGGCEGSTTGTPISMIIYNKDQRSRDYSNIRTQTRSADYVYDQNTGSGITEEAAFLGQGNCCPGAARELWLKDLSSLV